MVPQSREEIHESHTKSIKNAKRMKKSIFNAGNISYNQLVIIVETMEPDEKDDRPLIWQADRTGRDNMMEEKAEKVEQEDPRPLTDEEFAEYQRKEERKAGVISTVIDFLLSFFH